MSRGMPFRHIKTGAVVAHEHMAHCLEGRGV